jgi:RNA polymerase-binding transcription factor DksA
MARKTTKVLVTESRYQELKAMLEERRLELVRELHAKIRDVRAENTHEHNVLDEGEISDADIQEEIGFALIQMKSETLDRINTALRRISEGTMASVSSAGTRLPNHALERCPLRCGARTARKAVRLPTGVSAWQHAAIPHRYSLRCHTR